MCSSRIRGEIVFQKKARENGFRAQNPEKTPQPFKKMSENDRKSVLFFPNQFFIFHFLKVFLGQKSSLQSSWLPTVPIFSIFCSTLQENVIFCGWSEQKWIFSKFVPFSFPNQFFILHFLKFFFGQKASLQSSWRPTVPIFSIFCPTLQENSLFCVKYNPFLLKLRKSLPKVCFVGENPGQFTKNSSIS